MRKQTNRLARTLARCAITSPALFCIQAGPTDARTANGLAPTTWPKARGDSRNTGCGGGSGAVGELKWSFTAGGRITTSPVIGLGGTVLFGADDNNLYAVDEKTGELRWKFSTWGAVLSTPALGANGLAYFGSHDGVLYALDARTGTKRWQFRIRGAAKRPEDVPSDRANGDDAGVAPHSVPTSIDNSPAIGPDGTVYIAAGDGYLYALNGADGNKKWECCPNFVSGGGLCPSLSPLGVNLYLPAGASSRGLTQFLGIAGSYGRIRWIAEMPATDHPSGSVVLGSGGALYSGGYTTVRDGGQLKGSGCLFAFNRSTGRTLWRFMAGLAIGAPALGNDGLMFCPVYGGSGNTGGSLVALNASTGAKRWELKSDGSVFGQPSVASDGTVYCGSSDGNFRAINGKSGQVKWSFPSGNTAGTAPAIGNDGTVFIGSEDHKLYAIR